MSGWPDPEKPGVPANPERDGWHWLQAANRLECHYWYAALGGFWDCVWLIDPFPVHWRYVGPVLTPDEHRALTAERDAARNSYDGWMARVLAVEAERDAAAKRATRLYDALRAVVVAAGGIAQPGVSEEFLCNGAPAEVDAIRVERDALRAGGGPMTGAAQGFALPALSDDLRRAVHRAQYEHVARVQGIAITPALVEELVEKKVSDPEQRSIDEAAWAAQRAFFADAAAGAVIKESLTTGGGKDAIVHAARAALEEIARQKTTDEMTYEEGKNADFEGAYDAMIDVARAALQQDGRDRPPALPCQRAKVLEEAARLCEAQRAKWPESEPAIEAHREPVNRAMDYGRRQGCEVCAAALRALALT